MSNLRDFLLDLPHDLQRRRQFCSETRCITAFFARLFEGMRTDDCWRAIVECVEEISRPEIVPLLGVHIAQVVRDIEGFFDANSYEKKAWALDALMAGIDVFVAAKQWDRKPFEQVAKAIVDADFKNQWFWKRKLSSPSKRYVGRVLCEHEVTSMDIWLVVQDKAGRVVGRKKVLSADPQELGYARHLGRAEWTDDREFSLINQNGDQRWFISISEITK